MNVDLLYEYNPWWEDGLIVEDFIPRNTLQDQLNALMNIKPIIFLTGLRRVGKTTLMKLAINKLLADGVPANHILYISLDDYLLRKVNIIDILAEYRKCLKISTDTFVYLFFDEITYQADFRQQLKTLYDRSKCKIVVSASSSSALRDKRGWLTGRERHIEVQPLTFEDFLLFRDVKIKKRDKALLESYFEEYMQIGGMPEYVLTQDREYLTALLDDIIYKDIIAHHGIKQPQIIKDFFSLLMERAGKQISINKVAKILSISPDTAKRYLTMFEETYLIYLVPRYGKTNETILATKKVYAADLGVRHMFTGFRDKGAIFENTVFSMIKHKHPKYYYKDGIELDFMTEDNILIEVKYNKSLNDKQLALFEEAKADRKLVINGFDDLSKLLDL